MFILIFFIVFPKQLNISISYKNWNANVSPLPKTYVNGCTRLHLLTEILNNRIKVIGQIIIIGNL